MNKYVEALNKGYEIVVFGKGYDTAIFWKRGDKIYTFAKEFDVITRTAASYPTERLEEHFNEMAELGLSVVIAGSADN